MSAVKYIKPSFGTLADKSIDSENTFAAGAAKNQEATYATVMMTQLHDTRVAVKFHRLLLLGEDDRVLSTHPLHRKLTHVGRSRRNHVQITDPLVSVKHLTVSVSGHTCVVNDLDSSNGTFINGERLTGGQVLNDGDEIMLGKTVLRFATRRINTAAPADQTQRGPSLKKKWRIPAAAVLGLTIVMVMAMLGPPVDSGLLAIQAPAEEQRAPARPSSGEGAATLQLPVAAGGVSDLLQQPSQPLPTALIQQALTDYAGGELESAIQTLKRLSAAKEQTSEAFQAQQILAMFGVVQELYAQALRAQEQKDLAKALEYWDRLLAADMELVGGRPSFFAAQAERKVQALSYDCALDAYRSKNHAKARQLCRVILELDPKNQEAQALLAKIDPKA